MIARYGCPQGSLCVELDKRAEGAGPAAELMRVSVEWAQRQFEAMGRPDADDLAVQMIARYQGTALLDVDVPRPAADGARGRPGRRVDRRPLKPQPLSRENSCDAELARWVAARVGSSTGSWPTRQRECPKSPTQNRRGDPVLVRQRRRRGPRNAGGLRARVAVLRRRQRRAGRASAS